MCTILRLSSEPWAQILESLEASDVASLILAGNKKISLLVSRNWRNVVFHAKPLRRFPISLFHRLDLTSIAIGPSFELPVLALSGIEESYELLVRHEALTSLKLHFLDALDSLSFATGRSGDYFPSLKVLELTGCRNSVKDWQMRCFPPLLEKLVIAPFETCTDSSDLALPIYLPDTLTHLSIKGAVFAAAQPLPPAIRFLQIATQSHDNVILALPSNVQVCKLDVRPSLLAFRRVTLELSQMPRSIKSFSIQAASHSILITVTSPLHEGLQEIEVLPRFSFPRTNLPSTLTRLPTQLSPTSAAIEHVKDHLAHLELKRSHTDPAMLHLLGNTLKSLVVPPTILLSQQPTKTLLPHLQTLDVTLRPENLKVLPTGLTSLWIRNLTEGKLSAEDLAGLPRSLESFAIDAEHLASATTLHGLSQGRIGLKCLVVFKVSSAFFKSQAFLANLPSSMQRLNITGGFKDDVKELKWIKNLSILSELTTLEINVSMRILINLGEALATLPKSLRKLSLVKLNSFEVGALSHLPPNLAHLRLIDSSKMLTNAHFANLPQYLAMLSLTTDAPLTSAVVSLLPRTLSTLSIHLMKHGILQRSMNEAIARYWSEEPRWNGYEAVMDRDVQRQVLARFMGAGS